MILKKLILIMKFFLGNVEESEECIRDLPESITINPTFELTDKQKVIMLLQL